MFNENSSDNKDFINKSEKNPLIFDPDELQECDEKLFKILIYYARLFYTENMVDLGDKLINIAQNYYLTKIFY